MLIFLDFDGVLRRQGSQLYRLETNLVNNLEEIVREVREVEIVITSSWREVYSLSQLRSHFSGDIAERIVGVTPLSRDVQGYYRYREILAYLKRFHTVQTPWLAIDDDPDHFPHGVPVLIVDPAKGLDEDTALNLKTLLTNRRS